MQRTPRAILATLVSASSAVLVGAPPAAGHVTIPEPAEAGGFGIVTFSVPNERDDSGTVRVEVQLPPDHPLAFVSAQPKPGWEVEVTTRTLDEPVEAHGRELTEVVDTVTWVGGPLAPGQFDTFSLSVGPLPEGVAELAFPAVQTYESGEEVAWIQEGADAERPAPVLELVASEDAAAEGSAADEAAADDGDVTDDGGADGGVDALSVAALAVAAVALVVALARRRA